MRRYRGIQIAKRTLSLLLALSLTLEISGPVMAAQTEDNTIIEEASEEDATQEASEVTDEENFETDTEEVETSETEEEACEDTEYVSEAAEETVSADDSETSEEAAAVTEEEPDATEIKRSQLTSGIDLQSFSTDYPNTWTNTGNQAYDIAQVALTQVGYTETGSNHTKYNYWYYGSDTSAGWCAIFISWCANQADIPTSIIKKNAGASGYSTSNMSSNPYGTKYAYAFGSKQIKMGDIIFVNHDGVSSSDHVGLVVAVDDDYIYTVEGNSGDDSNLVRIKKYDASTGIKNGTTKSYIIFFARPAYTGSDITIPDEDGDEETEEDLEEEIVEQVTGTTFQVSTSGSTLSLRKGPGLTYTRYTTIANGTEIVITDIKTVVEDDGTVYDWGKTTYNGYTGWVCLKYCTRTSTESCLVHNFNEGVTTKEATCTTDGKIVYTCSVCGDKETETIEATGHKYTNNVCSVCGAYEELETPVISAAAVTLDGVKVTWNSVTDAQLYRVYRKTESESWTAIAETDETTYLDEDVVTGEKYTYSICCISPDGKKELNTMDSTGKSAIWVAPTDLSVSLTAAGVSLKWDVVSGAEGYYVYRRVTNGTWSVIKVVTSGSTNSYTDLPATSGVIYDYAVRPYVADGSTLVKGLFTLQSIHYLTAISASTKNTASGVTVSWSKVTGASGYYVYRKLVNGTYSLIKNVTASTTLSYCDTTAVNGTAYVYAVRPYASDGCKGFFTGSTIARLSTPTISSLTNSASKALTVKYNKNSSADGYQVMYSTSSSLSSYTIKTVSSGSTVSYKVSSLTKGKTYYVLVRSYKTVSGVKYYSGWSTVKSVKITK